VRNKNINSKINYNNSNNTTTNSNTNNYLPRKRTGIKVRLAYQHPNSIILQGRKIASFKLIYVFIYNIELLLAKLSIKIKYNIIKKIIMRIEEENPQVHESGCPLPA
jgi:hypothetical protein